MFKRTANGIANEHLFHRVDLVAYCEGRPDDPVTFCFDEVFWSRIVEKSDKKFLLKSLGSKSELRPIAEEVSQYNIGTVLVLMDADYDCFVGQRIDHPRVIYTFGYSWESDVCLDFDFERVLSMFVHLRSTKAAKEDYEAFAKEMNRSLRLACIVDICHVQSPAALFDRSAPLSIVEFGLHCVPKIRLGKLAQSARELRTQRQRPIAYPIRSGVSGLRSFYGKTLIRAVYHWFVYYSNKFVHRRRISFETFAGALLDLFDPLSPQYVGSSYYQNVLRGI